MDSKLAQLLKDARIRAGLSQREVADRLGYQTPQFISNWERGKGTPPGSVLHKIAKIYDMPTEKLYEVLLDYVLKKAEADLKEDFLGRGRKARA